MIDDEFEVMELVARMEESLPLKVYPSKILVSGRSALKGLRSTNDELTITSVVYTGDAAGVVCFIKADGLDEKKALGVSITHLRFPPLSPLAKAIIKYQRKRIKRLKRLR